MSEDAAVESVRYDILVPGSSLAMEGCFLGISTIVLIEAGGKRALFDCGHFTTRRLLLAALRERSLAPSDIDIVILSHAHFDHALNIDLFPDAQVYLSQEEWDYIQAPFPDDPATPPYIADILRKTSLVLIEGEVEILPGVTAFPTPGHSPGHMSLELVSSAGAVVLAADAVKTAREALSGIPDMEIDPKQRAAASLQEVLRRGRTIVPGHFPPLTRHDDGRITWSEIQVAQLLLR
ncbi:MBL fold metallo-hydrolase [Roseibium sp. CAU 1637]|uniref:MBL fold metallo-hydrolase n=1 Tax=Roseibium limicola TaxID=2816037 RepID=A0A939EJC7_9HYPH|nr:MBL fold metallo-hydrolase [Roseibium limicola]MBO0343720.1 MBL fold metallo-hydrolase [Roseibium limicola]